MTSLLFALILSMGAFQAPGGELDARLGAASLVDIGEGRRMNFFCIGEGAPVVVFEQGGEGNIANWKAVQPAISALTRTCFYDRAGFGYSEAPRDAVTALNVTDDLHALLEAERVEGPVVLVGHSIGGFYATVYASRFPDEVAGLVLVDPGFVGQEQWQTADDRSFGFPHVRRGEEALLSCARLGRDGELSRANLREHGCFPVADDLPPGETEYLLHAVTGPAWYEAEYSQSVSFFSRDEHLSLSQRQAAALLPSLGDAPMVVLSAAVPPSNSWRSADRNLVHGRHWQNGHRRLAERSTRGRWVVVEGAGHFIQLDQPQAVVASIKQVIEQVRTRRPDQSRSGIAPAGLPPSG